MSKRVADLLVETLQAAGMKNRYGIVGDTLNRIAHANDRGEPRAPRRMRRSESEGPVAEDRLPLSNHRADQAPLHDQNSLQASIQFPARSAGPEPDALAHRRPAGCKGTSAPQLEGFGPYLAQTLQDRPIEIPECRGLDPIGEHAHEQPSRKMGGSDPAQVVSPLEAKLIRVEAGKYCDRSVEGFAR